MKYLLFISAFFLSVTCFSQKKYALLVAVGDYPSTGKWKNLSSVNDIKYINEALTKNGFAKAEIDILKNEAATKVNILKSLDALYEKANEGDIIFFHFSGHGQQIEDDNGDELDGYDEALIPYDAQASYDPVLYNGQNHLRDDELKIKLSRIRTKIGTKGSFLVTIDACHSGTATRSNDFAISRGVPVPFKSPRYKPKDNININSLGDTDGFAEEDGKGVSNMVVISASAPNQVNFETKDADNIGVGSLSLAFAKAISDLPSDSDYELLFQKIKSQIQATYPMQIPMIEGNISQKIFSGQYLKRDEIISVQKFLNDSTFLINSGFLHNVNKGSTFQLFKVGGTEPVAEGTINEVSTLQSVGVANKKLNKSEAYRVKWNETNYGSFSASVFINNKNTKAKPTTLIENQLADFVQNQPFLSISNNADFMLDIDESKNNINISLFEKGDSVRWSTSISKKDSLSEEKKKDLLAKLKTAMQVKYLRSLADGGKLVDAVKVELTPKKDFASTNEIVLNPLDEFSLTITNKGPHSLYYTIINILPDNTAKVLLPEETAMPQDYIIAAGSEPFTIDGIQVDEGTAKGKEIFKIIFSKVPIDLRSVFTKTNTRSSNSMVSFEQALSDVFDSNNSGTTRSNITKVKVDEVGMLTVGFTVTNK